MKNFKQLFLMLSIMSAVILIIGGAATFAVGMTMLDWNFRRLDPDYGAEFIQRFHYSAEVLAEQSVTEVNILGDGAGRDIIVTTRTYGDFALYESDLEYFTSTAGIIDGTLTITVKSAGWRGIDGFWFRGVAAQRTRIYIPNDLALNVGRFNGSVRVEDLAVEKIDINMSSGSVRINDVTVDGNADIRSLNGIIRINSLTAHGDISLYNNNGTVIANNLISTYGNINITVRSGAIRTDGLNARDINATNISGGIRLENVRLTGDLTFSNYSGAVRIWIVGRSSDFDIDIRVARGAGDMVMSNPYAEQRIRGRVSNGSSRVIFFGGR